MPPVIISMPAENKSLQIELEIPFYGKEFELIKASNEQEAVSYTHLTLPTNREV